MIKKYESNHKEREEVMKEIKKRGYNDWKKKVRNKGNSEKEQRETKINREEVIKESMSGKKSKRNREKEETMKENEKESNYKEREEVMEEIKKSERI